MCAGSRSGLSFGSISTVPSGSEDRLAVVAGQLIALGERISNLTGTKGCNFPRGRQVPTSTS